MGTVGVALVYECKEPSHCQLLERSQYLLKQVDWIYTLGFGC